MVLPNLREPSLHFQVNWRTEIQLPSVKASSKELPMLSLYPLVIHLHSHPDRHHLLSMVFLMVHIRFVKTLLRMVIRFLLILYLPSVMVLLQDQRSLPHQLLQAKWLWKMQFLRLMLILQKQMRPILSHLMARNLSLPEHILPVTASALQIIILVSEQVLQLRVPVILLYSRQEQKSLLSRIFLTDHIS